MKIKTQDYNGIIVLELQGDLDSDFTAMLQNTITNILGTPKNGIVLNMNEVDFIDSEGLEQLLWARDFCNENRSQLRLVGLDENCAKILEITRLQNEFDSYDELAEAVKSFA